MAKAKYKIGNLVETSNGFQRITGVIVRKDSFRYETESGSVPEAEILAAFKPVSTGVKRKITTKKMNTRATLAKKVQDVTAEATAN